MTQTLWSLVRYAGLAAARALAAAGKKVLVLEARDRVGGRCLNESLPAPYGQYTVEAGAEFLAPSQTRMQALCKEFGIATFRTYNSGKTVNIAYGVRTTYSGVIPLSNIATAAEAGIAVLRLNSMSRRFRLRRPGRLPRPPSGRHERAGLDGSQPHHPERQGPRAPGRAQPALVRAS